MMIDIYKYLSREKISGLCAEIGVRAGDAEKALKHVDCDDFHAFAPHFVGLLSGETAKASAEAITGLCAREDGSQEDDGMKLMAVYLAAALRAREAYSELGMDDGIFLHTMGFFERVLREGAAVYGRRLFDRSWWYHRQLSNMLFRLGTLEFEMLTMEDGAGAGLPGVKNAKVLSVHIPSDAVMTRAALDVSYGMAREFFPKYYPGFEFKRFYCSTWLLAPALRELLPAGSKILNFQDDFELTNINEDDKGFIFWVYNTKEEITDYNSLPEDTSLRRAIKNRLLGGGGVGAASGYVSGCNAAR